MPSLGQSGNPSESIGLISDMTKYDDANAVIKVERCGKWESIEFGRSCDAIVLAAWPEAAQWHMTGSVEELR